MKFILLIFAVFVLGNFCFSQDFPYNSNAIHKDSSIIVAWASSAVVERGYINISDTTITFTESGFTSNKAFFGSAENCIGQSDGQFVSLGDSGNVVLQFDKTIFDGPGADFVVFENAIFTPPTQTDLAFVELAFVEVSSNGIDYERFPAVSNCQYLEQIGTFDAVSWNLYGNFAGIYPVFYGVPFDLNDITSEFVDKSNITHIRIVDAVGNINPDFASIDSHGNIVNDPWPTPFATCGFDLDAVGVINLVQSVRSSNSEKCNIYPNPAKDYFYISDCNCVTISVCNISGETVISQDVSDSNNKIFIGNLGSGIYFVKIYQVDSFITKKLIISD